MVTQTREREPSAADPRQQAPWFISVEQRGHEVLKGVFSSSGLDLIFRF